MQFRTIFIAIIAFLLGSQAAQADQKTLIATLKKTFQVASKDSGGFVYDLDQQRPIFRWKSNTKRIPASLEKLYTTVSILKLFGGDGTLNTTIAADSAPDVRGAINGNLYLIGSGDPSFGDDQLKNLAAAVRQRGISRITGQVIGDATLFDAQHGGPATNYLPTADLGGSLSALLRNRGIPDPKNPALNTAKRFAYYLRANDIVVSDNADTGVAPLTRTGIMQMPSPQIRKLINLTNTPSDNFFAEMLLKVAGTQIGSNSSTLAGTQVVRQFLKKQFAIQPTIVDGSGLSRLNQTSPRDMMTLLRLVIADPTAAKDFRNSLATVGKTGTLKTRMRNSVATTRCQAKTGTLIDVSGLAGYCTTQSGRNIAFVFMMNRTNVFKARQLQDSMTTAIASL